MAQNEYYGQDQSYITYAEDHQDSSRFYSNFDQTMTNFDQTHDIENNYSQSVADGQNVFNWDQQYYYDNNN